MSDVARVSGPFPIRAEDIRASRVFRGGAGEAH